MLRKPVGAAVALGLLVCAATVGLEAVGLLFHAGLPDPQERIDAFVARLEADLSPVDLPTEPVDLPREVAQELPGGDAERTTAAAPAPAGDGVDNVAESPSPSPAGPDGRSPDRLAVVFSSALPAPQSESAAQPDDAVAPGEVVAPVLPEAEEPTSGPLPAVQIPSPTPSVAQRAPRATAARRARPASSPAGYAAFGWPVLDWLTL
jgi:hypothetical protein